MKDLFLPGTKTPDYDNYFFGGNRDIIISGKKYTLLPIVLSEVTHRDRSIAENDIRRICINRYAIPLIAESYAKYYSNAGLGEKWTKEMVIEFLRWLSAQSSNSLFVTQWAIDEQNNVFPVGFFAGYMKPFGRGSTLWDCDLFVMPKFQKQGIGRELIKALFSKAKRLDIETFESLTYEDETEHPLNMWKNYNADVSELIHIVGGIDKMLEATKKRGK